MRRYALVLIVIAAAALGACDLQPGQAANPAHRVASLSLVPQGVTPTACPTDGTQFQYGTCQLPPDVAQQDDVAMVGAPAQITDVGCGRAVVPFGYTIDEDPGTLVCNPTP
jgi:hypothetical protein